MTQPAISPGPEAPRAGGLPTHEPSPYVPAPEPRRRSRHRRLWQVLLGLLAFVALVAVLYAPVIRPWFMRWGATEAELNATLPGDDLGSGIISLSTRGITIDAPAEAVWPWLAQMGQGRGGLYSYDWLENLAGCDIHSVNTILPSLQEIKPDDLVRIYQEGSGPPPFEVESVDPGRALVLSHRSPDGSGWQGSWAFVLVPVNDKTTRLLVRSRGDQSWYYALEPVQFLMERKMLYGIKERAERAYRDGTH